MWYTLLVTRIIVVYYVKAYGEKVPSNLRMLYMVHNVICLFTNAYTNKQGGISKRGQPMNGMLLVQTFGSYN